MSGAAIEGGCFCRAVRWRSAAPPIAARTCQCRICQYLGGGGGMSNAGFHSEGFSAARFAGPKTSPTAATG